MQKPTPVLILWGVPGTGKSTFAKYLVKAYGFVRIDSDAGGVGGSKAADAWRGLLAVLGTPAQFPAAREFARVARENPQPVVVEYGMWANEDGIELLRTLRDAGAEPWWFDGDRAAAFAAWKAENVKAARKMIDQQWRNVVRVTDANYPALKAFFGGHMGADHRSRAGTHGARGHVQADVRPRALVVCTRGLVISRSCLYLE